MRRNRSGFTLIEVIVALAIFGIVTAILSTVVVSSLRRTDDFGRRSQSAQVLNFLGRRVAGGDAAVLPDNGSSLTWGYGTLKGSFSDLEDVGGFTDPDAYRATIANVATVSLAGASARRYEITVCAVRGEGESCVTAVTLGPAPSAGGSTPTSFVN